MKTVIILNAPAGVGKDTIADMLEDKLGANHLRFKDQLYKDTAQHYSFNLENFISLATSRKTKDSFFNDFSYKYNLTPRQAMIHVSEKIIKPQKGADYYGECVVDKLEEGINVFSDGGGWWDELHPVAQEVDHLIITRLYREGFSFDNDSRHYYEEMDVTVDVDDKVSFCDINIVVGKPELAIDLIFKLIKI